MGMSTYIIGFREPDEEWKKMKKAFDACIKAGIHWEDVGEGLLKFFGYEPPDDSGIEVDLKEHECIKKYSEGTREGFEIDISKLPKYITHIRFVNSY